MPHFVFVIGTNPIALLQCKLVQERMVRHKKLRLCTFQTGLGLGFPMSCDIPSSTTAAAPRAHSPEVSIMRPGVTDTIPQYLVRIPHLLSTIFTPGYCINRIQNPWARDTAPILSSAKESSLIVHRVPKMSNTMARGEAQGT